VKEISENSKPSEELFEGFVITLELGKLSNLSRAFQEVLR